MTKPNVVDIYPLSPMQQGMLFHTLFAPGAGDYFEQVSVLLRGTIDKTAWNYAWRRLLQMHPILRTGFVWEDLQAPVQVVYSEAEITCEELDWQELSRPQQESGLDDYLRSDRQQGFEVTRPPLMRVALLKLAPDLHWMVWSHHHMLLDGWSVQLLSQQLFELYEASCRGTAPRVEKSRPYSEYIAWVNRQDQGAMEAYWRTALKGFYNPTPIGNSPTSAGQPDHVDEILLLSESESDGLRQFARRQRLTLNTLVQAAWALLLSIYSGEPDVVFGATVSGRPPELPGVENMIGLFINTLPVRVVISSDELIVEWLKRIQREQAEARQYGSAPLASIQMWSEVQRGQPLFETLVLFENYPTTELATTTQSALTLEEVKGYEHTHYPLCLLAWSAGPVGLRFNYDRLRFDEAFIRRMAGHYRNILIALTACEEDRISSISIIGEEERNRLLVEWNRTEAEFPAICAHTLFEDQAQRTPHGVAVQYESGQLTYEALNRRANQLGNHLRKCGVGPDVLVALHLHRSLDMLVAVLGILKAGGAYLPLDPQFPVERLRYMLEDSGAAILLTQTSLLESISAGDARVLCMDGDWEQISREPADNVNAAVSPGNLAYVLYTSGSTGRPKGVQLEHLGLSNLLCSMQKKFQITSNDILVAVTTLSFDIATVELLLPLTTGAQVRIASRDEAVDGHLLEKLLTEAGATIVQATPATWWMLLEAGWQQAGTRVWCGGEEMSAELARQLRERSRETWNMYGPTETTIWSTMHRVSAEDGDRIPIGKPVANTTAYILSRTGELLPEAVPGELYFGGPQVARGYLGHPELTAERFVPDPFGMFPGGRLYRTGDLARWRPDGCLEFLGRVDRQVKIRGFRIELGEVEAALDSHADVQRSIVVARADATGHKRLVAYLLGQSEADIPTSSELRTFLKQRLPDYMVPATYVRLDHIPLTPNGKVDHKQLPDPETESREQKTYTAPRDQTEEILCEIWGEVLKQERVGVHDDFFELGGHSLLAMQIASRVRSAFQIAVPLVELFRAPTVAELTCRIEEYRSRNLQPDTHSDGSEGGAPGPRERAMSEVLTGLESLSDEEVQALLGAAPAEN